MNETSRIKKIVTVAVFAGAALFWGGQGIRLYLRQGPMKGELAGAKEAYVGHWKSKDGAYDLTINRDATFSYSRRSGGRTSHFGGTMMDFDAPGFHGWTFPGVLAKFEVTDPPRRHADGYMHMTVDGNVLDRVD